MRYPYRVCVAAVALVAMFATGRWVGAQAPGGASQPPTVISGNDIGFRIEGRKGTMPIGVLVVRMNGQWVEVSSAVGPRRLTTR